MTTYLNTFYNPKRKDSKKFLTTEAKPTYYKGFKIYHRVKSAERGGNIYDIVISNECIGMYAGLRGAKQRIDILTPMMVKIKKNAYNLYCTKPGYYNSHYGNALKAIQGAFVPIETEYLFMDQFNTSRIAGYSENGLRIYMYMVEEIIHDARKGKVKCYYCGHIFKHSKAVEKAEGKPTSDITVMCPKCKEERLCENLAWAAHVQSKDYKA